MKNLLLVTFFTLIISIILTPVVIDFFDINRLNEPSFKTYPNDEISFLKTFYLMEKGDNFYHAYKLARENFVGGSLIQKDTLTWRLPTVFYLWSVFTNSGIQILNLFIFFCLISLICTFLFIKKMAGKFIALISLLLLLIYFLSALSNKTFFLLTEWWGLFFIIFGIYFYFFNHKFLAFSSFLLAILIRELFVLPLGCLFLYSFFTKQKKDLIIFGVPLGIFLIFYLFHFNQIKQLFSNQEMVINWQRFHLFSFTNLQRMTSFLMQPFVFWGLKTHYLVFLLGVSSLILNFLYSSKKQSKILFITAFSFILLLPTTSMYDNDYWGIFFMPIILISIPLIFFPFQNKQ